MKKYLTITLPLIVSLSACATGWKKDGVTEQEAKAAYQECYAEAVLLTPMNTDLDVSTRNLHVITCMKKKGFHK